MQVEISVMRKNPRTLLSRFLILSGMRMAEKEQDTPLDNGTFIVNVA